MHKASKSMVISKQKYSEIAIHWAELVKLSDTSKAVRLKTELNKNSQTENVTAVN